MRKLCQIAAAKGFTLVESIIVLVVLGIAAAGIAMQSGHIFDSEADNRTMQVGLQLMQECAERVLATSRASPGVAITPSCPAALAGSGFAAATATPSAYAGAGCPSGNTCRLVTIKVATTGGVTLNNPITVLLIP